MITLDVNDTYVTVSGASLQAVGIIKESIRAKPDGWQFMPAYRAHRWDGYVSLYEHKQFPSGLLPLVVQALQNANVQFVVHDLTNRPAYEWPVILHGYELRDYQEQSVQSALTAGRGMLKLATGAGKTLVTAALIAATGCNALVIVPTRALLMQTAEVLSQVLQRHVGMYGAGHKDEEDIMVTTMASLKKLALHRKTYNTVICDELHHARASSVFDYIFDVHAPFRFGLSATPLTMDKLSDLKIVGATGPMLCEVTNAELIEAGYLSKPIVHFAVIDQPKLGKSADYDQAHREGIVNNSYRNTLIGKICAYEADRGPVLVLVNWIEHVHELCMHMPPQLTVLEATGQSSTAGVEIKLRALRDKSVNVLIATEVFGEGVDVPAVATVVLADAGMSYIKLLQRIGRGMRVAEGKDELHVYDFLDDTSDYLLEHSNARYEHCKSEGFETKLLGFDSWLY